MQSQKECGCSSVTSIDQLCPKCLSEWEHWMETVAMPQLRQAMKREDAKTEEEEFPHAA